MHSGVPGCPSTHKFRLQSTLLHASMETPVSIIRGVCCNQGICPEEKGEKFPKKCSKNYDHSCSCSEDKKGSSFKGFKNYKKVSLIQKHLIL